MVFVVLYGSRRVIHRAGEGGEVPESEMVRKVDTERFAVSVCGTIQPSRYWYTPSPRCLHFRSE